MLRNNDCTGEFDYVNVEGEIVGVQSPYSVDLPRSRIDRRESNARLKDNRSIGMRTRSDLPSLWKIACWIL
jgi:hypothetical protein